jgi:hypothetical protein
MVPEINTSHGNSRCTLLLIHELNAACTKDPTRLKSRAYKIKLLGSSLLNYGCVDL